MKSIQRGMLVYVAVSLLSAPWAFAAMDSREMMRRLNDLTAVVKQQQQEIESLKQELSRQKRALEGIQVRREATTDKGVATQGKKASKGWRGRLPEWTERINVSGDLRLRYEGIYNRQQRLADNTTRDLPTRDRYRVRARLFFDGKVTDDLSTHFMICTNQDLNKEATTTNQSFSHDFNDKDLYLHRAYATYKPKWLKGLELTAGKFKNSFIHTDIMWDPDVNPEGIYERYQYKGWGKFQPFVHLGQMVVNESNLESDDAALYINQVGFHWKLGPVTWTLAGSYTDWANLHNTRYLHRGTCKSGGGNTFELDRNGVLQYKYDYNLWEGISLVKFRIGRLPVELMFDYIVNTAEGVPGGHRNAFLAGLKIGQEKHKGDWHVFYKYARIEKDAVIGSMNDQDFYGANRKGHKLTLRYLLDDHIRIGASLFYTDPVTPWDPDSLTFKSERSREHETRLQTEFLFKF
jgi:hypothetical protein